MKLSSACIAITASLLVVRDTSAFSTPIAKFKQASIIKLSAAANSDTYLSGLAKDGSKGATAVAVPPTPTEAATEEKTAKVKAASIPGLVVLEKGEEEEAVEEKAFRVQAKSEDNVAVVETDPTTDPRVRVQARYADEEMSLAIPFLKRPKALDGSHAGDCGFDPLGITQDNDLYTMMEAEIRHSRLAMLAVIGWPISELISPNWLLQGPNHLAPSVLNGVSPITFVTITAIFAAFGFLEYKTAFRRTNTSKLGLKHQEDFKDVWKYGAPGDYDFDPLDLYSKFGDNALGRRAMRELEVAHGRAAMIGITSFALWEKLTGHPIVENSMFFHPNLLLPAFAVLYFGFGFFYEVENDPKQETFFKVRMTSEGEMRTTRLKNWAGQVSEEGLVKGKELAETIADYTAKTIKAGNSAQVTYENIRNGYKDDVMKNIK